jgi:hypothetical protein
MGRSADPTRVDASRSDPFRELESEAARAVRSLFGERASMADFEIDRRSEAPLDLVLAQVGNGHAGALGPGSLQGRSRDELRRVLADQGGEAWARQALRWIEEGIPALVLVVVGSRNLLDEYRLGPGDDRLALASALGLETVPIAILRRRDEAPKR